MKRLAYFFTVALLLALSSTEASAWYCRASSPTGTWGWGRSFNLYQARAIALNQCSVRTPYGYACYLRFCR